MKTMTGLERVLAAIHRQEPDMIPTFESHIDSKVRDKIKPGLSYEDFIEYMDLDAITYNELETDTIEIIDESKGLVRDKWGSLRRYTPASELVSVFLEAPIKSAQDIKKYVSPDPDISGIYQNLEIGVKRFKGTRAVIVVVVHPGFTVRDYMLGQPAYFRAIKKNPYLIDELTEIYDRVDGIEDKTVITNVILSIGLVLAVLTVSVNIYVPVLARVLIPVAVESVIPPTLVQAVPFQYSTVGVASVVLAVPI